jgi:hypothetical protein
MGWLDAYTGKAAKEAGRAAVMGQREAADMAAWGGESARGQYGQGLDFLKQYYGEAGQKYQPMTAYGKTGVDAYQAAMGLGPQGAAGMDTFRNTPGYQFALEQGEDSVMRNAAARGMLAGGNTSTDLMRYGTGLADQTYQSYLKNLNPIMDMYKTGVAGEAGALGSIAQGGANAYTNMGNSYMNEAQRRSGYLAGAGEANAAGIMGQANAQAQTINAGLDLASKLATGGMSMPSSMPGTSYGQDLWKRYALGAQYPTYG